VIPELKVDMSTSDILILVSPPPSGNISKLLPKNIRLFTDSTFLVAKGN